MTEDIISPDIDSNPDTTIPPQEMVVDTTELHSRLDHWLHQRIPNISRGALAKWIKEGHILVNGKIAKPKHKPKSGDCIRITPPDPRPMNLVPIDLPLNVLYEDADLLVINKPPGLVVHPAAGHEDDTLVHALLHHCEGQLSGIGGVERPGIVHRLDQDTSGCIVVAKNDITHQGLASQFAERTTGKTYLSVNCGSVVPESGTIDAPIARHSTERKQMAIVDHGRPSKTNYKVIQRFGHLATLTEAVIHTGRTHQIRIHFKHLGYPVFGDSIYGTRSTSRLAKLLNYEPKRQLLHAWKLSFEHPVTNKPLEFTAPLPTDFQATLKHLARLSDVDLVNI
ncbi:MAG: RluA family pseudouridine synthase [Verrucomicrobia bacterium]|jgi:23S rRNA pseudouridine1911/1915/1917 synthase|nr:RluA family pseudouridine synthase [Verrucomicrobiota bacterium]